METVRATRKHFREGSTGGEFISALLKVVLSWTWLTGNANSGSSLFTVLGRVPGGFWALLVVGIVHLAAWTQPDRNLKARAIRKACSCVGITVWVVVLYDLIQLSATGTIILVGAWSILVVVAVFRQKYDLA